MPAAISKKLVANASYDGGVAAAMVWTSSKGKGCAKDTSKSYLVKRPDLGRPISRGYVYPDQVRHREAVDDGSAGEACRGWPGLFAESQEQDNCCQQECYQKSDCTAKKSSMKKSKKTLKDHEPIDPHIADLISHKYLYEYQVDKIKKLADERKSAPVGGRSKDAKSTRTSVLRAMSKVPVVSRESNKELWTMSKFQNARAKIQTAHKSVPKKRCESEICYENNEPSGPCTCNLQAQEQ